jgi:hypothetical protein
MTAAEEQGPDVIELSRKQQSTCRAALDQVATSCVSLPWLLFEVTGDVRTCGT